MNKLKYFFIVLVSLLMFSGGIYAADTWTAVTDSKGLNTTDALIDMDGKILDLDANGQVIVSTSVGVGYILSYQGTATNRNGGAVISTQTGAGYMFAISVDLLNTINSTLGTNGTATNRNGGVVVSSVTGLGFHAAALNTILGSGTVGAALSNSSSTLSGIGANVATINTALGGANTGTIATALSNSSATLSAINTQMTTMNNTLTNNYNDYRAGRSTSSTAGLDTSNFTTALTKIIVDYIVVDSSGNATSGLNIDRATISDGGANYCVSLTSQCPTMVVPLNGWLNEGQLTFTQTSGSKGMRATIKYRTP